MSKAQDAQVSFHIAPRHVDGKVKLSQESVDSDKVVHRPH